MGIQKLRENKVASLLIAGAFVAAAGPLLVGNFDTRFLAAFAVYFVWITLAESWNLAGGFAGLLNLGLVGFFGLGAIVGGAGLELGSSFPLVIAASGTAGVALALVLVPTFRLRSFYFALGTFVVPYMVKPLAEAFGGSSVFLVPQASVLNPLQLYYAGFALASLGALGVYLTMKSRVGFALRMLGNDETTSASVGVNVTFYKAVALVASGLLAGLAGLYYVEIAGTVDTTIFQNLNFSLIPVFMVVIGGIGTLEGPIVGALIYSGLNYFVTSQLPGSSLDTFVLSVAIVVVALARPQGLVPGKARRRGLR